MLRAHLRRLFQAGHGETIGLVTQGTDHLAHAMAVGIRLDHRERLASRRAAFGQRVVVADRGKVDGGDEGAHVRASWHFGESRVAATNHARLDAGRRQWHPLGKSRNDAWRDLPRNPKGRAAFYAALCCSSFIWNDQTTRLAPCPA
ncbi:hypothetical protein FQZ97_955210 [compost metagenome]